MPKVAITFDPFYMQKAGEKTYGKGSFWSGSAGQVEKVLEASLLCMFVVSHKAFPLAAKQTPNADEFKKMRESEAEIRRIDWYLRYILSSISMISADVQYVLVDAYFFKEKFVTGICDSGRHVISKMRKDAQLLSF